MGHPSEKSPSRLTALIGLLILADLVFIALHVAFELGHIHNPQFSVAEDRSYSEWFQYCKFFWIATCFGLLAAERSRAVYVVAALLFTYLVLDDAMRIHESVGKLIVASFGRDPYAGTHFSLRFQDVGEMLVTAIAGSTFLLLLVLAYWRGDAESRKACIHIVLWVGALGFCGVFLDIIYYPLRGYDWAEMPVSTLEDGGEMIVVSLIVFYCTRLLVRGQAQSPISDPLTMPK